MELTARDVVALARFVVPSSAGTWPCTRCSADFPVRDSWAASVRSRDREVAVVVCPQCASTLRPPTLRLDLTTLASVSDDRIRPVIDFVEAVARNRGAAGPHIEVRAVDTPVLADLCGLATDELADRLRSRGVLLDEPTGDSAPRQGSAR